MTKFSFLGELTRLSELTLLGNPLSVLLRNVINIHKPRLPRRRIRQLTQRPPACQPIRTSSLSNVTLRS